MRHAILSSVVAFLAAFTSLQASDPSAAVVDALHDSLAKKTSHLRRKLDEKDFRSLALSAAGVELLGEVLKARGNQSEWQQATGKITAAAKKVQSAAAGAKESDCLAAIGELEAACAAAKSAAPAGKPLSPPQTALRPLMPLIDGVYADAKISVMTGKPSDAKKAAFVLSELGGLVSNLRGNNRAPDQWTHLGGLMSKAALEAAQSDAEDPVEVRLLLRNIATRCDACHNAQ
jgi:hypothetical protein